MNEAPTAVAARNPYPGLRPFRTDEEHLFFGREHQVDRMIDKLAAHRFLAVVGTSGSGKSSLVNCGLRPALHRGDLVRAGASWRMVQFRPASDPIGALALALAAPGVLFPCTTDDMHETHELVEATLRLGSLGLVDIIEQARLPAGTQVLVVVDQFEELFRFRALAQSATAEAYGPTEDAVAFVRLLLEARAQSGVPIYVVLTMRSDFLGDCAQFQGLPEAINEGQYLVPRLTREEIRAAITGPAGVANAQVSPVLVTRLLNDVGDNPDQLSILQHALNRTWAHWEMDGARSAPLGLAHYEAAGGMAKALDMHADKAFGQLEGEEHQRLCERLFKALTDIGTDVRGVRRPQKFANLCQIIGAAPDAVRAVIDVFRKPSRSFLMPPLAEPIEAETVIDISHESLMRVWKRLKTWADEEAKSADNYRRLRETASLFDAGLTNLWRDPDLRLALDWRTLNEPNRAWASLYGGGFESAMSFLDRSRDAQEAERIEAEVQRRWDAGWRFVPMVIMALVFVYLQAPLAKLLPQGSGDLGAGVPKHLSLLLQTLLPLFPHVVAGIPAVMGYLILAPYARRLFWRRTRVKIIRRDALRIGPQKPRVNAREAPALDSEALGYASFLRRGLALALDWVFYAFTIGILFVSLAIIFLPAEETISVQPVSDAGSAPSGIPAPKAAQVSEASRDAKGGEAPSVATSDAENRFTLTLISSMLLIPYFYNTYCWRSKHQATWGMRLAGTMVTDQQGRPLSWRRASGRNFARWLSYYSLGIGFLMFFFNKRRQTLHDRMSGTLVLRRPPRVRKHRS